MRVEKDKEFLTLHLPFNILKDYHIQADTGTAENVIPTEISFEDSPDYSILDKSFSKKSYDTVYLDKVPHRVFSDILILTIKVKPPKIPTQNTIVIPGALSYQACNDRQCFFPRILNFKVVLSEP